MKKTILAFSLIGALYADTLLDTQVISDSGFSDSLADVSSNLFVINKEELNKKNYHDLGEILSYLPSISLNPVGIGSAIDIRGQGSRANARVKILFDGVSQNALDTSHLGIPFNTISVNDIEQIEVISGGGSVVYGNGTSGGVVNVITKSSLKKDYANLTLGFGSFSHKSIGASAGANINDKIYSHFGINYVDEKGYQRADLNKLLNTDIGFKFKLTDYQNLDINANYMHNEYRKSQALTEQEIEQDRRYEGIICTQYEISRFGFICKNQILASQDSTKTSSRKNYNLKYSNEINENILTEFMAYLQDNNYEDKQFFDRKIGANAKAKLNYDFSNTILGYEYLYAKGKRASTTTNIVKKDTHSIYAIEQLDFNPFGIDIGARLENSKYNINRSDGIATINDSKNTNNYGANIVLSHKFMDTNSVYFKFERGFNSPSPYELTDKADGKNYSINNLKSEDYLNYELGLKGLVFDQYASISLFYTLTNNEINVNMSHYPVVKWTYENIAKTKRYGVEISLNQSLLDDRLNLFETFSYIDAKVVKDNLNKYKEGQKIPNVSPYKISLGANYKITDKLSVNADYRFYSKTNWDYLNNNKQLEKKAYSLVDVGLNYDFTKNISLSLEAKNIFNTKYNLNCSGQTCQVAPTSTYYMQVKARF